MSDKPKSEKEIKVDSTSEVNSGQVALNRRSIWNFAAVTGAALAALKCSSGNKASFRGSSKERDEGDAEVVPEEDPPVESPAVSPEVSPSATPIPGAAENNLNQDQFVLCERARKDVTTLPDLANPGDKAKVVIYGKENHAMVVVELPTRLQVASDQLRSVSLHRSSGLFIAQYMLTAADVKTLTLYWPFVFKNIRMKFSEDLYIRYTFTDSLEFKQKVPAADVVPFNSFRGAPVKSITEVNILDNSGVIVPAFASVGPVVNFAENDSTGIPPTQNPIYNFSASRQLRTAQSTAKFNPAVGLTGFIITDLSGNVLSENGGLAAVNGGFVDIMNYPNFACYKLITPALPETPYYIRTIVSTG